MNQHQDHRYLVALQKGDSVLLEELYSKHSPQVLSWIQGNSGTLEDARDVFQEALMALYNKACDPDFVLTYPIGGLIFQICKNKWIDQIRKKNKDSEVRIAEKERYNSEQPDMSQLEAIEEEEIRQTNLATTFQQLTELCQKLLGLLKEGKKSKDIAHQLEMNDVNTVYRRKNACLERWRNLYHAKTESHARG
ncbi:sigma-70 family RNA polymerase sigma factor [bacterium]|nr:sigma-70 family RNA polymerase sigma factor [bacterium]